MTSLHCISPDGEFYMIDASTNQTQEINGDNTLSFVVVSNKTNERFMDELDYTWSISGVKGPSDKDEWPITLLLPSGEGKRRTIRVEAMHHFQHSMDKAPRIYERYDQSFTASNFFNLVFDDTPYIPQLVDSFESLDFEGIGNGESRKETFQRGLNRYGAEFEVDGEFIRLRSRIERNQPYMLHWQLNASNIKKEIDALDFWTFARGYGDFDEGEEDVHANAGLVREYTSPLANIVGEWHAPPIKDGRITTNSKMDSELKKLVDESVKVTVTLDFQEMKKYPYAQPQTGDIVTLVDDRINFNQDVRIIKVKTTRDVAGRIVKREVTLGDKSLRERNAARMHTAAKFISEVRQGARQLDRRFLDAAVQHATAALQSAETELIFDNGIIAQDKNNPNNIVLYNSAGLGVSSDGGQTFENAITGNGINATAIYTGSLTGITITQESGNQRLVMENGRLFSYMHNDLTMIFGRYDLEFFNRENEPIGKLTPLTNVQNPNLRGLGLEIDNDFFTVGIRGGDDNVVHTTFRSSVDSQETVVAGPYKRNNDDDGSSLVLIANSYLRSSDSPSFVYDQPAIVMRQSREDNDMLQYFGGYNRRLNAIWQVRWRESESQSQRRIEANAEGGHLSGIWTGSSTATGNILGSNGNAYYENGTGSNSLNRVSALNAGGIVTLPQFSHLYLGARSGGEVRVTDSWGVNQDELGQGGITYRNIRAAGFVENSSVTAKDQIKRVEENMTPMIMSLNPSTFYLKEDLNNGIYDNQKMGFLSQEVPSIFRNQDGIEFSAIVTGLVKSFQELASSRDADRKRIKDLEEVVYGQATA